MTARNGRTVARIGADAELEFERFAARLLGLPARRKLGAGRRDDHGDIDLIPGTTVQVSRCTPDELIARLGVKLAAVHTQRLRAGTAHAVVALRIRRGPWRMAWPVDDPVTPWLSAAVVQIVQDRPTRDAVMAVPALTAHGGGPVVLRCEAPGCWVASPETWAALWTAWRAERCIARPLDGQLSLLEVET